MAYVVCTLYYPVLTELCTASYSDLSCKSRDKMKKKVAAVYTVHSIPVKNHVCKFDLR